MKLPTLNTAAPLFNAALDDHDSVALAALLQVFGTEALIERTTLKREGGHTITEVFRGTPLGLACHLKQEATAIQLLTAGAAQTPYTVSREGWFGWTEAVTSPLEAALASQLKGLTLALMQANPAANWSFRPRYDQDSFSTASQGPTLFQALILNPTLLGFLDSVGSFRGSVGQHCAGVDSTPAGFVVTLNRAVVSLQPTFAEGLLVLGEAIALERVALSDFDEDAAYEDAPPSGIAHTAGELATA
jgi:hypothetical protein